MPKQESMADHPPITTKTIVFITGSFVNNSIWDDWRTYFEMNGYITIAPSWPYKESTTDELRRRQPDSAIASVGLQQLVEHYAMILKQLPEKAILIGHSLGGLVTQLLLQKDLAMAGVVIHSFPPKGIAGLRFSFWKSLWAPLGFFTSEKKSYLMKFSQWQYAYTNGMSLSQQRNGYQQFVVPESKKVVRDIMTAIAKIDFKKIHAPLLFLSGSEDRLMPASLNYSNYKNYLQNGSITEFKEFKGKNHFVIKHPDWHETAGFILNWLGKQEIS
jgi:pimeloyl-ACP methyl ester carboxylesterase